MTPRIYKRYVVRVSENALISLILSSLEAYSVKKKDIKEKGRPKSRIEVYGSLFGHEIIMKNKKIIYQVEMVHTDTTAEQRRSSVDENKEAIALKADVIMSFWPHLIYLGDFHSHPFKNAREVLEDKKYFLSEDDREWLNNNFWKQKGYRVGIVMTIAAMEKAGRKTAGWVATNCVEATLGNYRMWLAAYCAYSQKGAYRYTNDNDMSVTLDCPALTGLRWEHADFGRFKNGKYKSS
ncbi:MAG TPA: hypothetical protein DCR81_00790 [Smithella sp.]|nr:hypothetical protein [Smithella sp.]